MAAFMTQNTFERNYLCYAFNGTRLKNCRIISYALAPKARRSVGLENFARDIEKLFMHTKAWSGKKQEAERGMRAKVYASEILFSENLCLW
jgi:hypothetical protein